MKPVTRATGRSAVAAAAYRTGEKLLNERDGVLHDFTRKTGIAHTEIVLPQGMTAEWALDRSTLWNAAEAAEKRSDARVAREFEVSLPHELDAAQRLALTREFAVDLASRYGVAVDFAIHEPHHESDIRNHHAHFLLTTRRVEAQGLGAKSMLEMDNKQLRAQGFPSSFDILRENRRTWEEITNAHLARAGLDLRIDHRSHQERGLEIEPTGHVGVHATQVGRRGIAIERSRLSAEAFKKNAELIRADPSQVLTIITGEKSVFDRQDIARTLYRYVTGHDEFQSALAKLMASPELIELRAAQRDESGRETAGARYSTREMINVERGMGQSADRLAEDGRFRVSHENFRAALEARRQAGMALSGEQRAAVEHLTAAPRIAALVGLAGAGKSTTLAAARETWEAAGYRVQGAALAGKATEGLQESSGIASRTLASWELAWSKGKDQLGHKDVLVIDEAGMIGSRQLAKFVAEADRVGAKVVLVGDPEQLQPIGPGAAFRAIAERIGYAELGEIRRQREDWQREASKDFGRHRTAEGLAAYNQRGAVHLAETKDAARVAIVRSVLADMAERPQASRLVLAHTRQDVQALNDAIRAGRQARGELEEGRAYMTTEGTRQFAVGDRLMFRENNRDLGVRNGMLGTVRQAEAGRLVVAVDSAKGPAAGKEVAVSLATYAAVDHGYAATIHKSQGATVDRAYVLASQGMDRHLTYVAMTRHREDVQLHAGRDDFKDGAALTARLSRENAKETTLDYGKVEFAARRGVEIKSEILASVPARDNRAGPQPTAPAGGQSRVDRLRDAAVARQMEPSSPVPAAPERQSAPATPPSRIAQLRDAALAHEKAAAQGKEPQRGQQQTIPSGPVSRVARLRDAEIARQKTLQREQEKGAGHTPAPSKPRNPGGYER